jgi:hypothetical protein
MRCGGWLSGVTKRCRLYWLTNSDLVYESKCEGGGGCGVSANEYSCALEAQINFGELTPYLTYAGYRVRTVNYYKAQ